MRIFAKAPILGIGSVVMAFLLNKRLALIIFGIISFVAFIILLNLKISYPIFTNIQIALDKVNGVMREYLSGIRVVKAFNRFKYESIRFRNVNLKRHENCSGI
jgi:ATP-binding cassette subfamily B protein